MVDKDQIRRVLGTYFVWDGEIEIQDDGIVNVEGHVQLVKKPPQGRIPIKFGIVDGEFRAIGKGLTSLWNTPDTCDALVVPSNLIQSLEHVTPFLNMLDVENNKLTSFKHGPEEVAEIKASINPLTSLEGLPEDQDIPLEISLIYSEHLPLLRLVSADRVHVGTPGGGFARLEPFEPVNTIINKYTGQGKSGAIKCAAELVRAGFKENAKW